MPDPLYRWVPPYERTNGDLAAAVGADLGLVLDDDQRTVVDAAFAYDVADPDMPVCFSVATVGPRQSIGKTAALEVCALTDLFVFREPLHVWTAHLFETAQKSFERMVALIDGNREYRRLCRKPRMANGDEAIELLTGEKIEFHARSKGGGRGMTAPKVTLDEALFLQSAHMGALLPTMATIRGAQVRYGSSAGLPVSDVLRGLRDRGRAGGDPRLFYVEQGSDRKPCGAENCLHRLGTPGCALDDRDLWFQANYPGLLTGRITESRLEDFRREMPADEFAREFLGWWEDPPFGGGVLDVGQWAALAADPPELRGPSFGVDLDEAGTAYFAVAWHRPDGLVHVQLAGRSTASRLQDRADELTSKHGGQLFAGGPAAKLLDGCEPVSSAEFAAGCRRFADLFDVGELRHSDEPDLNDSVGQAKWRSTGADGAMAWQLKDVPGIGPLAAVTRALHGLMSEAPPAIW